MRLYTSLVRLKLAMNDGRLPPMTPIPVEAHDLIDPAFTIGLGALSEDAERGLRCPIRECGEWHHRLTTHIVRRHKHTSPEEVRRKLSIPQTARLISQAEHDRASQRAIVGLNVRVLGNERAALARAHRKSTHVRRAAAMTIGAKNLLDSCPNQLSHKIIDLHNRTGRTPTGREANLYYGQGFTTAVIAVYGTWNNAIALCGLEARKKSCKYDVHDVLQSLSAYYEMHGVLPSAAVARKRQNTPLLPATGSILRVFKTDSYPVAMRRAAALLDIHTGRYGLPPIALSA